MDITIYPSWKEDKINQCTSILSIYLPLKPYTYHILRTFSKELNPLSDFIQERYTIDFKSELCVHPSKEDNGFLESFHQWVKAHFLSKGVFQDMTHKDFLRSSKYFPHHTIIAHQDKMMDYTHLMASRWECWHSSICVGYKSEQGWVLMPTHGSAIEMHGLGITNPTAWLMMLAISSYLSGDTEKASKLWQAIVENRAINPENTTPDEGGILTTNNYIRNIVTFLQK